MKPITLVVTLLASAVTAQSNYTIDPASVNITTRDYWCTQQKTQCPLICLQAPGNTATPLHNDCDPEQLSYACICSNGISPNVSEFSQTLPYFICTQWGDQCVSNCGQGNNECANACRANHPCGALNPQRQNTSTLTSTMTSTTGTTSQSSSASFTGFGDGSETTSSALNDGGVNGGGQAASLDSGVFSIKHVRVWALSSGQTFGTLGVVGALVGGAAILL